jgi:hypothetical protein
LSERAAAAAAAGKERREGARARADSPPKRA